MATRSDLQAFGSSRRESWRLPGAYGTARWTAGIFPHPCLRFDTYPDRRSLRINYDESITDMSRRAMRESQRHLSVHHRRWPGKQRVQRDIGFPDLTA
jgi:hypothetical protein